MGLLMPLLVSEALAAAGPSPTPSPSPPRTTTPGFFNALSAEGRIEGPGLRDLYDGLLGSWDAEVVDRLPDGSERRQSAEIHFAWVLEGRALQDVWIAPARSARQGAGTAGNRYGTTLRVYDPAIDAWRITWMNPVTGAENRLVGRRVGSQIVQTGADAQGRLIRWVFAEVRPDAFHWRGERSEDGGRTWTCDTEFFARRRPTSPNRGLGDGPERRVSWEWTDRPGLETLSHAARDGALVAEGDVLVTLEAQPLRVRYRIEHDLAWRFQEARVDAGLFGATRELYIHRNADGGWEVNGTLRPDLDGCEDVDLMVTPYTNTPPLGARPLAPGASRRLRVAWVRFPDLEVHPIEQEYTRLDDGTAPERYRYRNLESGFVGELVMGTDGLVLDYGPWKRR